MERAVGGDPRVGRGRARRAEHERQRLKIIVGTGERDRARDHVAELANVAGPVVVLEPRERPPAHLGGPSRLARALEEAAHELAHVTGALTQRRDVDLDDREPVVQVAAEPATRDLGEHIAVGGRDDAHVVALGLARAERNHLAGLEHAQELRLQRDGQVADLVEEQRASMRGCERTHAIARRAGERTAHVPEQVTLDQRVGRGAAVEHDEGTGRARRGLVKGARHQLLAGAALAQEQRRRGRARRPFEDREHLPHREGAAVQLAELVVLRRRDVHDLVGRHQLQERLADPERDPGRRDRLRDRDAIADGAVARPEIGDREAGRGRRDRAVPTRHERIGQHDVAGPVRPDDDPHRRQVELHPAVGTVDHVHPGRMARRTHRRRVRHARGRGHERAVQATVRRYHRQPSATPSADAVSRRRGACT